MIVSKNINLGKKLGTSVFLFLSFAMVLLFAGCASTEEKKTEGKQEYISVEDLPAPVYDAYSTPVKKWNKKGRVTVKKESGSLRLEAKGKLGSFNYYIIDRDENLLPVFSKSEEFTGTSFYLKVGKKLYKLAGGSGIKTAARETENGMQISYIIPKVAHVVVDFSLFSSLPSKDGDMIKMTAHVKSLKTRKDDFSLKLVMDTELGEKNRYHFFGADNNPVTTETMYRSAAENRWIMTGNELMAFQILLDGADISTPDFVTIANYENLDTLTWEPSVLSTRSFDTVSSYNNSGCCIAWKKTNLEPEKFYSNIVYFAVAAFPEMVTGESYINTFKTVQNGALDESSSSGLEPEIITQADDSDLNSEKPLSIKQDTGDALDKENALPDLENLSSQSVYSKEYINRLLNRISELENDGRDLNQEELLLLNEELDLVLKQLRKD